jgi:hypothetical protein
MLQTFGFSYSSRKCYGMGLLKAAFLIGMLQCANSAVQDANSGVMCPKSRRRLAKLSTDRYPTCPDCDGYGHYQTDHYKTNCGCAGSDRLTDRVTRGCPAERRCEKCTCNTCKGSGVMGPRRRLGKLSTDQYPDCSDCNGYGQLQTDHPFTNCGCEYPHKYDSGNKSDRGCPAEKRCEKCTCETCDGSGVMGPNSRKRRSLCVHSPFKGIDCPPCKKAKEAAAAAAKPGKPSWVTDQRLQMMLNGYMTK